MYIDIYIYHYYIYTIIYPSYTHVFYCALATIGPEMDQTTQVNARSCGALSLDNLASAMASTRPGKRYKKRWKITIFNG